MPGEGRLQNEIKRVKQDTVVKRRLRDIEQVQ